MQTAPSVPANGDECSNTEAGTERSTQYRTRPTLADGDNSSKEKSSGRSEYVDSWFVQFSKKVRFCDRLRRGPALRPHGIDNCRGTADPATAPRIHSQPQGPD